MARPRLMAEDMVGLDLKRVMFIIEYCKDYNARRAAKVVGFRPDQGYDLLAEEAVDLKICEIARDRINEGLYDPDWVMFKYVDVYNISMQEGKLAVANAALTNIGKLAAVDAFAAEKVMAVNDNAVLERLKRGRDRSLQGVPPVPRMPAPVVDDLDECYDEDDIPVSFL